MTAEEYFGFKIGDYIRKVMEKRGYSPYKVAQDSGLSYAAINKIIKNETEDINLSSYINLCSALSIDPCKMFHISGGLDNMDSDDDYFADTICRMEHLQSPEVRTLVRDTVSRICEMDRGLRDKINRPIDKNEE